jgi:hypothetical protein
MSVCMHGLAVYLQRRTQRNLELCTTTTDRFESRLLCLYVVVGGAKGAKVSEKDARSADAHLSLLCA